MGKNPFDYTVRLNIRKEKLEILIESARDGLPLKYAFDRASIPFYYYQCWLKLYNDYIAEAEKQNINTKELKDLEPIPYLNIEGEIAGYYYTPISLVDTLKKNYADWIYERHKLVAKGDKDKWQASAWLLERRAKADYARDVDTTDKVKIDSVKVNYVDPKADKKRLEQLIKEVKENVGEGK